MNESLDSMRFAVLDVEGNGQTPPEIIEIAILPLDGLAPAEPVRSWLMKPSQPITPIVTRKVHGIKNSDVADAPAFTDIAAELTAALGDRIPVAHNARIDHEVLSRQLPTWKPPLVIDTLRLARAVWPGLKSYSLDPLLAHAQINTGGVAGTRHRAGFDTQATAELFTMLAKTVGSPSRLLAQGCLPGHGPDTDADQGGLW